MDIGDGATDRETTPNPENHGASIREQGVDSEEETTNAKGGKERRAILLLVDVPTVKRSLTGEPEHSQDGKNKTGTVPSTVLGMHNGPDGVVGVPGELGNGGHEKTGEPGNDADLEPGGVHRVRRPSSSPGKAAHKDTKTDGEEAVDGVVDLVGHQSSKREDMEKALVVDNEGAQRSNTEEDGGNGGHDEGFITRDAHVPEREVFKMSVCFVE